MGQSNGVLFKKIKAFRRCPSNRNLLYTVCRFESVLICAIILPTVNIIRKIMYSTV